MKSKYQLETFSRSAIMPVMESGELNTDSDEVLEGSSNRIDIHRKQNQAEMITMEEVVA